MIETPSTPHPSSSRRPLAILAVALGLAFAFVAAGCGSDSGAAADAGAETGLRTISVDESAAMLENPPADLVVLDVRTPEEFAEGHIEDAELLDFYRQDFAGELATLDPDAPYLLYCRSGNRSGQTLDIMSELGFTDVSEIDGGMNAWTAEGMPVTQL